MGKSTLFHVQNKVKYIPLPERKGYFYTLLQCQRGKKHTLCLQNTDLKVSV